MNEKNLNKIKAVKKVFDRFVNRVNVQQQLVEGEIKDALLNNEKPSPALLIRWKQLKNLEIFGENSSQVLNTQLILADIGSSITNALGSNGNKNISSQMAELQNNLQGAQEAINFFGELQQNIMGETKLFTNSLEEQNKSLNGSSQYKELLGEFIDKSFAKDLPNIPINNKESSEGIEKASNPDDKTQKKQESSVNPKFFDELDEDLKEHLRKKMNNKF